MTALLTALTIPVMASAGEWTESIATAALHPGPLRSEALNPNRAGYGHIGDPVWCARVYDDTNSFSGVLFVARQALSILTLARWDRRLSGSSHSRHIPDALRERGRDAAAAQKTIRFALTPPTHAEMRACPGALARPVVPVFCGLGPGADDL
jgi:hypothetical protein